MTAARLYLSGPISLGGVLTDEEIARNIRRFRIVAEALRADGLEVVDPTTLSPGVAKPTWLDWMRADIRALIDCDGIVMMPGWEASKGARIERQLAEDLGLQVRYYERVLI